MSAVPFVRDAASGQAAGEAAVLVVQLQDDVPVGRLGEWLREAGLELDVRRADRAEHPADISGHAGLVVLGGARSPHDDDVAPLLPEIGALLRGAVSDEVPVLGVGLGGQLLALANGGRVEVNPHGPEIGAHLVAKRSAAATDPLFAELPIMPDVIQWSYDAITVLPPGAIQLASSPSCENQAFRLGRLAWGVQFHIETTPPVVRAWADADASILADYELDVIVERADAVHQDIEQTWRPFAAAFAAVVRQPSAVPDPRGVPVPSAAPVSDPAAIRAALAAELNAARQPLSASSPLPLPTVRPTDGE